MTLRREQPVKKSVLAFSSAALALPRRKSGGLVSTSNGLAFVYRPWLVKPSRAVGIVASERILRYGVFYSHIVQVDNGRRLPLLILPPRYRRSEAALALLIGCDATPSTLKGGMRATVAWITQL